MIDSETVEQVQVDSLSCYSESADSHFRTIFGFRSVLFRVVSGFSSGENVIKGFILSKSRLGSITLCGSIILSRL